jgi:hypothetical protein
MQKKGIEMKGTEMKGGWITAIVIGLLLIASSGYAAIYHIDPVSGNSANNGSAIEPFKSWSDLPAMKTGDDVYFKCGTTYSPTKSMSITWQGTSSNPVVIGAYYLDGNTPIYGVKGNRPTISGHGHTVPGNAGLGSTDSWTGLIQISNKDYVHIQNLHIFESGFYGIGISGNTDTGTNSAYFLIDNVKVESSYDAGIIVNKNPYNYGVIQNSEVLGSAYNWKNGYTKDWPESLVVFSSPHSYTTIKNNFVHQNWGEGIGSGKVGCDSTIANSGYVTIEDNSVWDNRRVDIYLSRTEHNTVRRNLLAGSSDSKYSSAYSDGRSWNQYGIWINLENRGACSDSLHDNSVYNNFVAGHYSGIGLSSSYDTGKMQNIYIYNNTSIANKNNYSIGGLQNYQTTNIIFKNNVSYCPAGTTCQDVSLNQSWVKSKITADYNAWENQPAYWAGAHDKATDNKWAKTSGWQSLTSLPDKSDFLPLSGNVCIGTGTSVNDPLSSSVSLLTFANATSSNWSIGAVYDQTLEANDGVLFAPTLSIKSTP